MQFALKIMSLFRDVKAVMSAADPGVLLDSDKPTALAHCIKLPSITLSWQNILYLYSERVINRRSSASGDTVPQTSSGVCP